MSKVDGLEAVQIAHSTNCPDLVRPDCARRGRALMRELYHSELATDEERRAADAVLYASGTDRDTVLRLLPNVGKVEIQEDTDESDPGSGPA